VKAQLRRVTDRATAAQAPISSKIGLARCCGLDLVQGSVRSGGKAFPRARREQDA